MSSMSEGLTKKEGFKPESASPAEVKRAGNSRPKHEGKVKRTMRGSKK